MTPTENDDAMRPNSWRGYSVGLAQHNEDSTLRITVGLMEADGARYVTMLPAQARQMARALLIHADLAEPERVTP